ncbi:PAS domain-containing protein, partial [Klebsiella pneumoniae]
MPRPKRSSSHVSYVKHNLEQIFDNFPDTIFVTDARGNVLLSNSTTAVTLGITLDQLLRSNIGDLVKQGYYNKSYALEAAEKKCPVGGLIHTMLNFTMESKSVPVLDDEGNVIVVITTSNP